MNSGSGPHSLDVSHALTADVVVNQNLRQEIVVTTEDKLKLCLLEHEKILQSKHDWVGALGLFITLITTLAAAKFEDKYLPAATWDALYVLGAGASAIWTLVLIRRAFRARQQGGITELIAKIKRQPSIGVTSIATDQFADYSRDLLELLSRSASIKTHPPRPGD